ncbi:hypothetical protein HYH03_008260 [Edaphochlamys debaryana]|uniref:Flagellar associated protein n=1 Tax=Edaphochlamys debaryana TaxID=47281 RepID=A0A835XYJ9_9CHLO|nr:hypothetical protein HYH03_008260 [Edaphochlamys debaryana]|eukprot:KAG2493442.1 hypothetical protein HYH03_008260 [Edaphochlamys debaryana]
MRSTAPRLASAPREEVPFGAYNIDKAHKRSLESECRDTRRFYSGVFDSTVPRFTRPWTSPTTDAFYDPERLKDHAPVSISKGLEVTPINYAIHRSRYKRFPDRPLMTAAPDVVYEVDCHLSKNKCSLYTGVVKSAVNYRNMGSGTGWARTRPDPYKAHLGPGSYDYKSAREVSVSPALDNRPLSSMASGVRRFGTGEAHRMIGQSWTPERANKHWGSGTTISKTEYLRPQYLPRAYESPKKAATS